MNSVVRNMQLSKESFMQTKKQLSVLYMEISRNFAMSSG